jgi:hypothetical protein
VSDDENFDWYLVTDANMICLKDVSWAYNYVNLIPKSTFDYLINKTTSTGLDLSDYLSVYRLKDQQQEQWISCVKELSVIKPSRTKFGQQEAILQILSSMSSTNLNRALGNKVRVAYLKDARIASLVKRYANETEQPDLSLAWLRIVKENLKDSGNQYTYQLEIFDRSTSVRFPLKICFPICTTVQEVAHSKE